MGEGRAVTRRVPQRGGGRIVDMPIGVDPAVVAPAPSSSAKADPNAPIPMTPVASEMVSAVGYDAATKRLALRFKDGTYTLSDVPADVYAGLLRANADPKASVGKFVRSQVLGKFASTRDGR